MKKKPKKRRKPRQPQVLTVFEFRFPEHAKSAPDYQEDGGKFDPELHFTGAATRDEVTKIQGVIDRNAEGLVAYYSYAPIPGMYSVELQYATEGDWEKCSEDFHNTFPPEEEEDDDE